MIPSGRPDVKKLSRRWASGSQFFDDDNLSEFPTSDMGNTSLRMILGQRIFRAPATANATVGDLWMPDAQ